MSSSRGNAKALFLGDVGLASARATRVSARDIERLGQALARKLPRNSRLYVRARPDERPGEPASSQVELDEGEVVVEIGRLPRPEATALLEVVSRELGFSTRLVFR